MDSETYRLLTEGQVTGEYFRVVSLPVRALQVRYPSLEAAQTGLVQAASAFLAGLVLERVWEVENGQLEVSEVVQSN